MIRRLLAFPLLVASACVLAAMYGALHNQISYTVSPGYFYEFKFLQFGIDPMLHNRMGAALVGALASWWMGLILSVPIFAAACFVRGDREFLRCFLTSAMLVVMVTLAVGLGALTVAVATIGPDTVPWWAQDRGLSNPVRFARAGQMHDFSYLGGVVGALIGLGYAVWCAIRSRRAD